MGTYMPWYACDSCATAPPVVATESSALCQLIETRSRGDWARCLAGGIVIGDDKHHCAACLAQQRIFGQAPCRCAARTTVICSNYITATCSDISIGDRVLLYNITFCLIATIIMMMRMMIIVMIITLIIIAIITIMIIYNYTSGRATYFSYNMGNTNYQRWEFRTTLECKLPNTLFYKFHIFFPELLHKVKSYPGLQFYL